jgi:hypothetical protein
MMLPLWSVYHPLLQKRTINLSKNMCQQKKLFDVSRSKFYIEKVENVSEKNFQNH